MSMMMMSKRGVSWSLGLAGITFFVFLMGSVGANALEIGEEEVGVTLDFTYVTKYIWHGYDVYDDDGSFQPSITVDYKGFYAGVWYAWPDAGEYDEFSELDLFLGYERSFFEEERYALDSYISYTYFAFPKTNSDVDAQEIALGVSMPNLLPIGPSSLVPSYEFFIDWDGVQSEDKIDNGVFHTLGLSYDFPITALISTQEENVSIPM